MCDYGLDLVASRPAKVGDELVTTEFPNSMTRGFAAIGEPNVAVCLLPSTEIAGVHQRVAHPASGMTWTRSAPLGMRVMRRRASFISAPVAFSHRGGREHNRG